MTIIMFLLQNLIGTLLKGSNIRVLRLGNNQRKPNNKRKEQNKNTPIPGTY